MAYYIVRPDGRLSEYESIERPRWMFSYDPAIDHRVDGEEVLPPRSNGRPPWGWIPSRLLEQWGHYVTPAGYLIGTLSAHGYTIREASIVLGVSRASAWSRRERLSYALAALAIIGDKPDNMDEWLAAHIPRCYRGHIPYDLQVRIATLWLESPAGTAIGRYLGVAQTTVSDVVHRWRKEMSAIQTSEDEDDCARATAWVRTYDLAGHLGWRQAAQGKLGASGTCEPGEFRQWLLACEDQMIAKGKLLTPTLKLLEPSELILYDYWRSEHGL